MNTKFNLINDFAETKRNKINKLSYIIHLHHFWKVCIYPIHFLFHPLLELYIAVEDPILVNQQYKFLCETGDLHFDQLTAKNHVNIKFFIMKQYDQILDNSLIFEK